MTRAAAPLRPDATPRPVGRRPPGPRPDPVDLCHAVAVAYLEVEAGRRPFAQLTRLVTPALAATLLARLRRRGALRAARSLTTGPATYVETRAVRGCAPTGDAVEVAVVVRTGDRVEVLAVRAERFRGLWRIVDLGRPGHPG